MPTKTEINEQNQWMLKRQHDFRLAAEYVAQAFAQFPVVRRIALFGSVPKPLIEEIPRFRQFRRAGIPILLYDRGEK